VFWLKMRPPTAGGAPIGVVQATRDRQHVYRIGMARQLRRWRRRAALPEALMRPYPVAGRHVRAEHAGPLPRTADEHVVEARATHAPAEPCAHGIRLWRATRANAGPHLPSLSRIRERGRWPKGVACPGSYIGGVPRWR